MSEQDYAINYQPLFTTLETMDVQALIDQVTDPWYNQTLIQVGGVLVRLGVMQGEFLARPRGARRVLLRAFWPVPD